MAGTWMGAWAPIDAAGKSSWIPHVHLERLPAMDPLPGLVGWPSKTKDGGLSYPVSC